MTASTRLDVLMAERGIAESRSRAQALIMAGRVLVEGAVVTKAGSAVPASARVELVAPPRYVSRGGEKLETALRAFAIDVTGERCLDVGASTGGFTQVLLERGARRVYAVDVGRGQLHDSLRARPEVVSLEETDIRKCSPATFRETPNLVTVDVSFISLKLVLPAVGGLLKARATLVALVKPQFEAGRRDLKKGIVRDAGIHATVEAEVTDAVAALGWRVLGVIPSPLLGGDGNREFLLGAERG